VIKLYVTRHGKALSNEKKLAASISEKHCGGLSKLGEKQAEELVPELLKNKYDIIIVSPMIRAYQTLIPYLKTFTYPPKMIISDLALERDLGDLRGTTIAETGKHIEKQRIKLSGCLQMESLSIMFMKEPKNLFHILRKISKENPFLFVVIVFS